MRKRGEKLSALLQPLEFYMKAKTLPQRLNVGDLQGFWFPSQHLLEEKQTLIEREVSVCDLWVPGSLLCSWLIPITVGALRGLILFWFWFRPGGLWPGMWQLQDLMKARPSCICTHCWSVHLLWFRNWLLPHKVSFPGIERASYLYVDVAIWHFQMPYICIWRSLSFPFSK